MELASAASELQVAKGKKVIQINLKKDRPADDELLKLMLGPTGNLRAPTLQVGRKLVVGFNEEMYQTPVNTHNQLEDTYKLSESLIESQQLPDFDTLSQARNARAREDS